MSGDVRSSWYNHNIPKALQLESSANTLFQRVTNILTLTHKSTCNAILKDDSCSVSCSAREMLKLLKGVSKEWKWKRRICKKLFISKYQKISRGIQNTAEPPSGSNQKMNLEKTPCGAQRHFKQSVVYCKKLD